MHIQSLTIILFLASLFQLKAQDLVFKASAPKYVRVGEQFQVQFSTNKSIDDFVPPSFENFDFLGGPMQSSSSSSTYINGKLEHNTTISLIYYLRATNPGVYTLDAATATYKRKSVSSNVLTIEVVGNNQQQQSQQQSPGTQSSSTPTTTEDPGNEIFLSLVFDKRNAYVGEQITAYVKIYTKVSLSSIERQTYKGPDFPGFFKQDLEIPPLTSLEREKVGNDIYHSGVIQKFVIYPQKAGKIVIEPFDLTVYLQKQVRQPRSIFDDFFGQAYSNVPVKLTSKAVSLNINALPIPQPDGFSGAVGHFSLSGSLNTNKVRANDAVSFKVSLSGKGNINLIEGINTDIPPSFEVYDPVVKTALDKSGYGGSKVFEITAIPRHAGNFSIAPFSLVYFDPASATYKTLRTQDFNLEVYRGAGDSSLVNVSGLSKEEVELLGSDIRFIKTTENFNRSNTYTFSSVVFYLVYLVCLVLIGIVFYVKREKIKRNADMASAKHRKAGRLAGKRFKVARNALKHNNYSLFYDELSKALWGYLSDKLLIPVSSLSADSAKAALAGKGVDTSLTEKYLGVIQNCELARYAKGLTEKTPTVLYDEAVKVLLAIDQKL
ncbi:MAG: protein BatD [Bacteroidales bacterium]|nr:protein BatD [Bacteroidales bacterium]